MNSESLVSAIFSRDGDAAAEALHGALANKIADALEVKKVEIASSLLNAEDSTNELETTEVEVDGSADAADAGAETVSPESAEG